MKKFILLFLLSFSITAFSQQYKVSHVTGKAFPSQSDAYTQSGSLENATFSSPMFLCIDTEKNLTVIEREFSKNQPEMDRNLSLRAKFDTLKVTKYSNGIISVLNEKKNKVRVLKNNANYINAPTVSKDRNNIYIPSDIKFGYYFTDNVNEMQESSMLTPPAPYRDVVNWKFSFAINPNDTNETALIYTVMYNRELLRFNPTTNRTEILTSHLGYNRGSDVYLAFNPKEDNVLYISVTNTHSIYRIDLKLDSIYAKPYAGLAVSKPEGGIRTNRDFDFAGGTLEQARFAYPRQIAFDKNGVLYIADATNHCIRSIDTQADNPTVKVVAGTPTVKGHRDGNGQEALFAYPMGIAIADDGDIYVADTRNYCIRKIKLQGNTNVNNSFADKPRFNLTQDATNKLINIEFINGFQCDNVQIIDLSGKVIQSKPFAENLQFNTSTLRGVYIIKVGRYVKKIVIQ